MARAPKSQPPATDEAIATPELEVQTITLRIKHPYIVDGQFMAAGSTKEFPKAKGHDLVANTSLWELA